MTWRSLNIVTNVYYRSMSCFIMISRTNGPAYSAKVSRTNCPTCTLWVKCFTKYDANLHSTEQDTLPIVLLISKQAILYQTHGDTCCPRVSTPKIQFLPDSSTTYHDGINNLYHSNHCLNHSIDPHMVILHLNGWKTTTLSQIHKPNLIS
jgi:hypothetical protein